WRTRPYNSTPFIPPPSANQAKGYLLPDFYSGATRLSGRFSEGLLLRRLHGPNYFRRHCSDPSPVWCFLLGDLIKCYGAEIQLSMPSIWRHNQYQLFTATA
ncbi:hypothetical protein, partial [Dongia mobilis]|uniref:hypothetical protein n=1 Tax=Dongia sp. TaxID=1977262 RepID=UPI0026F26134